uniref:GST N-terminal domain-containing protein n=1 Tax=Fundulus heteroclitus TaxID=8078 RepID=A0A3Q2NQK8_FUNHE
MSSEKRTPAPSPVPMDCIRLYSMIFCPYTQRARLVLHTPAGEVIYQSPNCKHLDEAYPEKRPRDIQCKFCTTLINVFFHFQHLVKKKTKFNYMMWPFFERIMMGDFIPHLWTLSGETVEDPAVKATIHSVETHTSYFKAYAVEKPDYEYRL